MRRAPEDESTRVALGPPPADEDLALLVLSGPARGRYYKVPRRGGVVGRDQEVPLRIDDPGISRQHCRIVKNGRGYFEVEDLGSRYGTFVEGRTIQRQVVLDGDRIQLSAETTFRVRYQDVQAPEGLDRPSAERVRDPLTRLHSRRYLLERFEQEYAFARRHQAPLSVLMLDIDHFQRVNEEYGRGAADRVLRMVARVLHNAVRTEDLLARIGGDEFAVIIRPESEEQSLAFSQRLLRLIRERTFVAHEHNLHLTCSVGISNYSAGCPSSMMELLVEADAALNEAKRQGRDRAQTYLPQPRDIIL